MTVCCNGGKMLHNIRVAAKVRPARNTQVVFQCVFGLMEDISGFLWAAMFLHSSDLQKETDTAAVWQKKTEEKVFVTTR